MGSANTAGTCALSRHPSQAVIGSLLSLEPIMKDDGALQAIIAVGAFALAAHFAGTKGGANEGDEAPTYAELEEEIRGGASIEDLQDRYAEHLDYAPGTEHAVIIRTADRGNAMVVSKSGGLFIRLA